MSEDKHQEKNEELPRESLEEFSKRVGLKRIKEQGAWSSVRSMVGTFWSRGRRRIPKTKGTENPWARWSRQKRRACLRVQPVFLHRFFLCRCLRSDGTTFATVCLTCFGSWMSV